MRSGLLEGVGVMNSARRSHLFDLGLGKCLQFGLRDLPCRGALEIFLVISKLDRAEDPAATRGVVSRILGAASGSVWELASRLATLYCAVGQRSLRTRSVMSRR